MKETTFQTAVSQYNTITAPYIVNATQVVSQIRAAVGTRKIIIIHNNDSANAVTIGIANTVTNGAGPIQLAAGESITLEGYTGALWAICDAGDTATLSIWEGTA